MQIRGDFSVDSVDPCEIIARRRRRTAQTLCETLRLCVRRKYVLMFFCQTQNSVSFCALLSPQSSDSDVQFCVQIFRSSVLAPARYEKIEKSEISNPLGGHLDFAEICCIFV